MVGFFFVHFANIEAILGLSGFDRGDNDSPISSPVVDNTFDFSG
jgi:hypothetical protein